ncbi:MAG: winged helix DNA-binding protein [Sphingomonadales bacterium]|nr:winged helix DNA-binding protein [Sphingomonadales bacterium]
MSDREVTLSRLRSQLDPKAAREKAGSADVSALGWDEIGFLCEGLAFAARPLRQATQSVTERYDLGPRGAWIINVISGGVAYPLDLARVFKVGRSLITAELARLTEAGLITSRPGEADRRRVELALTPEGEAASAQICDEMRAAILRNLAGYSADEVLHFAEMLRTVRGDGADC